MAQLVVGLGGLDKTKTSRRSGQSRREPVVFSMPLPVGKSASLQVMRFSTEKRGRGGQKPWRKIVPDMIR